MILPKRITVEVDKEFHREVKVRAGIRNMSIKQYVKMALTMVLEQDRKYLPLTGKENG